MADIAKLDAVLAYIEEHPKEWRQSTWGRRTACGTAMCVAGHVAALDKAEMQWTSTDNEQALIAANGTAIFRYAKESLGLSDGQAEELFDALNSMSTLRALRDALADDVDYDEDGD